MSEFIMLMGLPACGKSTFSKEVLLKQYVDAIYLSSDAIRKESFGDESIQGDPSKIFDVMLQRTRDALKAGKNVIYDATNVVRKRRISLLKQLPKDTIKTCYLIWSSYYNCILDDSRRSRHVGESVIRKMLLRFEPPWYDEGWDRIRIHQRNLLSFDDTLKYLDIPHDNPHHKGTILDHVRRVEEEVDNNYSDDTHYKILKEVAKFHDFQKPFVKTFEDFKGNVSEVAHYYEHQHVGAYCYLGIYPIKDVDRDTILYTSRLIDLHMMKFFKESGYYRNLDKETKKLLSIFNECDIRGA